MTYFGPKIYNRQNLLEKDRKICDMIRDFCNHLIDYTETDEMSDNGTILDQLQNDIIADFCERLRERLGYHLQDIVVGIIDDYPEDMEISEIDNPDTYYYKGNENDK